MKKIIGFAALAFTLSGCSSYDHTLCRDSVVREVGTQDVYEVSSYRFVAKDSKGNVWYYETMNQMDAQVSKKQPVFGIQN
jgi:hypothetical protein